MSLQRQWRVTGMHHVAFAHPRDQSPTEALKNILGLSCEHTEYAAAFAERMHPVGDGYIQTLEVTGEGTVQRFVDRRGAALHHLALRVDDIEAALLTLQRSGVPLVDQRHRPGALGTRIAFIHPSAFNGLLVELVQDGEA